MKDLGKILEVIANFYGINADLLKSKTRKRHIVKARQIFFYFSIIILKDLSLETIAKYIGQTHGNALYSRAVIITELGYDTNLQEEINLLRHLILARLQKNYKVYKPDYTIIYYSSGNLLCKNSKKV